MKNHGFLAAILILSFCSVSAWSASNLNLTKKSVAVDEKVEIGVTANTVAGSNVLVTIIADLNGNGTVNGEDFPVQKYRFEEGKTPAPVHDGLVYDTDGSRNGHINAVLNIITNPHWVGNYIFEVSDSAGPVRTTFQITENTSWQQVITGKVVFGGSGIGCAVIAVQEDGDGEYVLGHPTDASGNFSIRLPMPGKWMLFPIADGKLTRMNAEGAAMVDLSAGQSITLPSDLKLFAAPYTITGRLRIFDGENYTDGVPDVRMFAEYWDDSDQGGLQGFFSMGWTDANGQFTLPSDPGNVGLSCSAGCMERGLVTENKVVQVVDADLSNQIVEARLITAVIKGSVNNLTQGSTVHEGLSVWAEIEDSSREFGIDGSVTDLNGDYSVGVIAGTWGIDISSEYLALFGYVVDGPSWRQVTIQDGETINSIDFTISEADTFLTVRVREGSAGGPGVSDTGFGIHLQGTNEWVSGWDVDQDGNVTLPISPGEYNIGLYRDDIREMGYAPPSDQTIDIAQGETRVLTFVLYPATCDMTVTVLDKLGAPVQNVDVYINYVEGQNHYWATSGRTSDQGQIVFPLRAGDYSTGIGMYPGYPENFLWSGMTFSLVDDEHRLATLRLYPKEATINAHVEDGSGNPLPGVNVFVKDQSTGEEIFREYADGAGDLTLSVPGIQLVVGVDPNTIPQGLEAPADETITLGVGETWNHTFVVAEPGPEELRADIDEDGDVDNQDLMLLMQEWGQDLNPN